ncbi:MAG: hypothetical protein JWM90_1136 [Thermoleophilia bacterium]|nr:hypothetical protein [Thermoleophilia bacterium]
MGVASLGRREREVVEGLEVGKVFAWVGERSMASRILWITGGT